MSERGDSYDFLGWAPDLGIWDDHAEPSIPNPPPRPLVTAPPPLPQQQAPRPAPPRSAPAARQASAPAPAPQRSARPSTSMAIVPLTVAFAAMCIVTLMTALSAGTGDADSTPVPLLVCLAVTTVLGFAWRAARR